MSEYLFAILSTLSYSAIIMTYFGVNYYPHPDVVFKADVQMQNDDAESRGDINSGSGFNLGMGYQFW